MKNFILIISFSIFSISLISQEKINDNIKEEVPIKEQIKKRLEILDKESPMEFIFNEINYKYIQKYLTKDRKLISRMLAISPYYFPMIEQQLDRFDIPLELKYLTIVESALNPRAKSRSGATGIWQFMYPTGKQYGLEVTSYIDERKDPLKATIAACEYLEYLYNVFEDWNLALAAYNAGPGYLMRLIEKKQLKDYWSLRPYLRKETQGYIPAFVGVTYAMKYYEDHDIKISETNINLNEIDTISFKYEVPYYIFSEMFCVPNESLDYLNPSFKKDILPKKEVISLPVDAIMDIVRNEEYILDYLSRVERKEILVNEKREVYIVVKGDSLSKIGKKYNVKVNEIKKWNNLTSDHLSVGDKLILYVAQED